MVDVTYAHEMPLLIPGQARKDVTHNEALLLIDNLMHPVVQDNVTLPPTDPVLGACWLVEPGATGAWYGMDRRLAFWTDGGWRFALPRDGMVIWHEAQARSYRLLAGEWVRVGAERGVSQINPPGGGSVVDAEARAALMAILSLLYDQGWARP